MTKRTGVHVALLLSLVSLFGLGFGLNYGSSTQSSYILRSVKLLHPELWTRDWLVSKTVAYHPAYAALGAILLRLSPAGKAVAWANVGFIALGMLAVYVVVRLLSTAERALAAFCVVLILASVTRTAAPGLSYAFCEVFLPSTLGSVGLLAAAAAYVAGRPALSGIFLAFAGVFHVNCLVLGLCVFGLAWAFDGGERRALRALLGLGPACLVLSWFLPFLLVSARPGTSIEAARIFQELRLPHHYVVPTFAWDFAPWCGFQLLGFAALLGRAERGSVVHRRLKVLLSAWWVLIVPAAVLSSLVVVPAIRELCAWRICAEAELLAQASFATALVGVLCDGYSGSSTLDWRAKLLGAIGVAALVLGATMTGKWNPTLVALSLLGAAFVISKGFVRGFSVAGVGGLPIARVMGALLITLLAVNVRRFSHFRSLSNVVSGGDRGNAELCAWTTTNTPRDAVLLTPPDVDELRLCTERAIVVDWKTTPAEPAEVLAWFERIEDVTGRRPFRSDADLRGYEGLDNARIAHLRARYGFDYVVVKTGHELELGLTPVFSGRSYVVYAMTSQDKRADSADSSSKPLQPL